MMFWSGQITQNSDTAKPDYNKNVFEEVNKRKHWGEADISEINFSLLVAKPLEIVTNKGSVLYSTSPVIEVYGALLDFIKD